jgi:SAM-dependent methyltransferase
MTSLSGRALVGNHTAARNTGAAGGHADLVRTLFEAKAAGWPAKYAANGRLSERLIQVAGAVRGVVPQGSDLLDLGCGSGELARQLAAAGYRVTGCDIAPAMLRKAVTADTGHTVSWVQLEYRWQLLPLASASLDAVVSASVLEYIRDPGAVLAECARVLRPGGVLVGTVPDVTHPVRWLEWPLRAAARTPRVTTAFSAAMGLPRPMVQYLTYLRVSCQRRPLGWWYSVARRSGLEPLRMPRMPRNPLRLLVFTRPTDPARRRPVTVEEQ